MAKAVSYLVIILLIACSMAISGCSSMSAGGSGTGAAGEDGVFSDEELALANKGRWGEGTIPNPEKNGLFKDILFSYDSAIIAKQYHETLRRNANFLLQDSSLHAEIEGHCDNRGTNEYNLALGEERARSVASLLVRYGVAAKQLSTISYGEEIPVSPGHNETSYSKNRRAHFALYRSK